MNRGDGKAGPVVLHIAKADARRLRAEILGGTPAQREAVRPFAVFLERRRAWRGPEAIQIVIGRPEILRAALEGTAAFADVGVLERAADIQWLLPNERLQEHLLLFEWQAMARDALRGRLRGLGQGPQRDLFASARPEK